MKEGRNTPARTQTKGITKVTPASFVPSLSEGDLTCPISRSLKTDNKIDRSHYNKKQKFFSHKNKIRTQIMKKGNNNDKTFFFLDF